MLTFVLAAMLGQVPQPTEPVTVPIYRIGTLNASSDAKKTAWIFPSENKLDTRKLPDGKSILFTGPPGTYRVYEVALDEKGEPKTFERTLTIIGEGPAPQPPGPLPPGPNPPGPTPPLPPGPGKYGVAPLVFDMAMKLPPSAKEKAPAVAAAFRSLSSAIAAGTIGMMQVSGETRKALDAATSPFGSQWAAVENAALAKLKPQIKSLAGVGEAYGEIAVGLGAVK